MDLIGSGISFISFTYLGFLLAAAIVRYAVPEKACAPALLVISWLFYCSWNPACFIFLLITTVSTWLAGLYFGSPAPQTDFSGSDGNAHGSSAGGDGNAHGSSAGSDGSAAVPSAGWNAAHSSHPQVRRKAVLVLTIVLNAGLLFFCKYWGMFFPGLLENRLLPVGISFYTLQALGYVIDTYRYGQLQKVLPVKTAKVLPVKTAKVLPVKTDPAQTADPVRQRSSRKSHHTLDGVPAERSFISYALFIAFFPGILSGPIERAGNMLPQYRKPGRFDYENMRNGLMILVWGYFLKLVLADRIAIVVNTVYADPETWKGTMVVLAVLLYSLQIYCDFAGYSAIAIGSARVLGFRVMQNFEAPYLSGSVAEFWRRWHISLSTWFRDYLYIPLGGNRRGTARRYLNILIVFAVSGLWHGADFSFLLWGILHGVYQIIGYALRPARDGAVKALHINRQSRVHIVLKGIITFLLVSFAWIFFRADSTGDAFRIIRCMGGVQLWKLGDGTLTSLGLDTMNWVLLAAALVVVLLRDLCVYRGISLRVRVQRQVLPIRWFLYLSMVMLILICGIWGPGYDASSFIYSQF